MSRLSQLMYVLNAEKMPTESDFNFHCDSLERGLHNFPGLRREYKSSIEPESNKKEIVYLD